MSMTLLVILQEVPNDSTTSVSADPLPIQIYVDIDIEIAFDMHS